jgi:hypothetical protein
MKIRQWGLAFAQIGTALTALLMVPAPIMASSHMDAPLITRDPSAHITDVYAFVSRIGNIKYLTAAVAVYPFEEPSIGPNKYNFDDNVLYAINIASGTDLARANPPFVISLSSTLLSRTTIRLPNLSSGPSKK